MHWFMLPGMNAISWTATPSDGVLTAQGDFAWTWSPDSDSEPDYYQFTCTVDDPTNMANDTAAELKCRIAIIKVDSVVWEPCSNPDFGDNLPLELAQYPVEYSEELGGNLDYIRMYPDFQNIAEAESGYSPVTLGRHRVNVIATLDPPNIPNILVSFRAFDLDERGTNSMPLDANGFFYGWKPNNGNYDNRSEEPNIIPNAASNSSGQAISIFEVGMQPGDNWRVGGATDPAALQCPATGCSHGAGLCALQAYVEAPDGSFLYAEYSMELVVWRKLHLELDTMLAPDTGTPGWIFDGDSRLYGNSFFLSSDTLEDIGENWLGPQNRMHQLLGGEVDPCEGSGYWSVIVWNNCDTLLTIGPGLREEGADPGDPYVIDVDDPYPDILAGSLEIPSRNLLASALEECYITVVEEVDDTLSTPVFYRNIAYLNTWPQPAEIQNLVADNYYLRNLETESFWCAGILSSYDASLNEDADPNGYGGTAGIIMDVFNNVKTAGYAFLFRETLFDMVRQGITFNGSDKVLAHEIGHQMGPSDIKTQYDDEVFGPCIMNTIRTSDHFSDRCKSIIRNFKP